MQEKDQEINQKISQLQQVFQENIYSNRTINLNETYMQVDLQKIGPIITYIHQKLDYTLLSMFANDETNLSSNYALYYVFGHPRTGHLLVLQTFLDKEHRSYDSITAEFPGAYLYEREINDLFGLVASGNPDLKRLVFHANWPEGNFPLRKDFNLKYKPPFVKEKIKFNQVSGTGVFEIPVGPVHAGIIEPGHFNFSVAGEPIINLEAQLFYTHKGIEKIAESANIEKCFFLAERISGDESFSNSMAYCQAIEKIAGIQIPERATYIRVIFAEVERLTSHFGDLAGLCTDVAYGFAAFQFKLMRSWSYLLADELCGMRFLRSVNKLGGVKKDFISGKEKKIIEMLNGIKEELRDTVRIIKKNSLFMDRVENKGIVKNSIALDLHAVGPAARAAGVRQDVRKDYPYAAYSKLIFSIPSHHNGDVNCRMNVKIEECFTAIDLILQAIEKMPEGKVLEPVIQVEPYRFALGMTESPRGENIHWIMTGENNTIFRYKIRTPSFCNWPVVCHAVNGNIVPDFPMINKSFNLSYAGNDL